MKVELVLNHLSTRGLQQLMLPNNMVVCNKQITLS